MEETPTTPDTNFPTFSSEFDHISIPPSSPPFDDNVYNSSSGHALLGDSISDLRFYIDGDGDFELTLDSVDDLYFPSENESFVIPVDATNRKMSGEFTPESVISGDCVLSTSGCCNQESTKDSDCSGTEQSSTQEPENCVSDVSEATIASSSSSPESEKMVVDQKFKVEEGSYDDEEEKRDRRRRYERRIKEH